MVEFAQTIKVKLRSVVSKEQSEPDQDPSNQDSSKSSSLFFKVRLTSPEEVITSIKLVRRNSSETTNKGIQKRSKDLNRIRSSVTRISIVAFHKFSSSSQERIAQLARYGINPNMVSKWKQQALRQMAEGFSQNRAKPVQLLSAPEEIEKLHAKIGQLTAEWIF